MYDFFMNSQYSEVLQVIPFAALAGAVYLIVRLILVKIDTKRKKPFRIELVRLIFVCYIAALFALVWVPENFWSEVWFYLLNGYRSGEMTALFNGCFYFKPRMFLYLSGELTDERGLFMLAANVIMLIPMGFLLPFLWKKHKWWKMLIAAAAVPLVIEFVQPIFSRSCDVDDMITNAAGVIIGYLLFRTGALIIDNVK